MSEQRFTSQAGMTYRVVGQLGTPGGFGSVVKVVDEEGRNHALKTLHFGVPAEVIAAEAENLRRVRHENVVGYVDFGIDPQPFLVMELADGGTLKDYINEARQTGESFPVETVLEWTRQLLRGLSAIHLELLHRDLKPGNVLLEDNALKIGDFGIARLAEASTREQTLKGVGTPAYKPPEGWEGPTGPSPTVAYDLYSLGVILFELMTLQLPFAGDREALRRAHLFSEPPSLASLRADIPPPLERLILQLLRKDPAERGAGASAALELISNIETLDTEDDEPTSQVVSRLQQGASWLMRQATEREAALARAQQAQRDTQELIDVAMERLDQLITEAADVVARSVEPLQLERESHRGEWQYSLQHSTRQLVLHVAQPGPLDSLMAANAPGRIVLFGSLAIKESNRVFAGSNIVAYTTPDAP